MPPLDLSTIGPWGVVTVILLYLFSEVRGLKGRVSELEGLKVLVERFRNFYEVVRQDLLDSCEFHRNGDRPSETQIGQWERSPSVEELMGPSLIRPASTAPADPPPVEAATPAAPPSPPENAG